MCPLEDLQRAVAQALVQGQAENQEQLAGISADELRGARETLFRKRRSQTRQLLPRTHVALGELYTPLFRRYFAEQHYSGYRAPLLDAVGFSDWLRGASELPPWLLELARWEAWPLRLQLAHRLWRIIHLRWKVWPDIALHAERPPQPTGSLWLAYRWGNKYGLRRIV